MPLSIVIQPGHTFDDQIPFTADDLNAAARPTATVEGAVGASDLGSGIVTDEAITPGPICFGFCANIANDYSVGLDPAPTVLTTGLWLSFKVSATNTGPATLKVAALGVKPLVKNLNVPLVGGDLRAGQTAWTQYDGASWQLLTPPELPPLLFGVATGTATALVLTLPELEFNSYADILGRALSFVVPVANTGAVSIIVNGKGSSGITKLGNAPLNSGDLPLGAVVNIMWDGLRFQLLNSASSSVSLPDVVTPGTTVFPASITVDAKGRITAITPGAAGATFTFGPMPVPASGTTLTSPPHGLGATPAFVRCIYVCTAPSDNWLKDDEVDSSLVTHNAGGPSYPAVIPFANLTVIGGTVYTAIGAYMPDKNAPGTVVMIDFTKWKLKFVAKL